MFISTDTPRGIYNLSVEVEFGYYVARAHRTIEIVQPIVERTPLNIEIVPSDYVWWAIFGALFIITIGLGSAVLAHERHRNAANEEFTETQRRLSEAKAEAAESIRAIAAMARERWSLLLKKKLSADSEYTGPSRDQLIPVKTSLGRFFKLKHTHEPRYHEEKQQYTNPNKFIPIPKAAQSLGIKSNNIFRVRGQLQQPHAQIFDRAPQPMPQRVPQNTIRDPKIIKRYLEIRGFTPAQIRAYLKQRK